MQSIFGCGIVFRESHWVSDKNCFCLCLYDPKTLFTFMITGPSQGCKKSTRNYCDMFFWHNFVWRNRIHCPFNILNWLRCPKNRLKIWPKIQRILKIYKGKKFPTLISILLVLSNFIAKIGWTGDCDSETAIFCTSDRKWKPGSNV